MEELESRAQRDEMLRNAIDQVGSGRAWLGHVRRAKRNIAEAEATVRAANGSSPESRIDIQRRVDSEMMPSHFAEERSPRLTLAEQVADRLAEQAEDDDILNTLLEKDAENTLSATERRFLDYYTDHARELQREANANEGLRQARAWAKETREYLASYDMGPENGCVMHGSQIRRGLSRLACQDSKWPGKIIELQCLVNRLEVMGLQDDQLDNYLVRIRAGIFKDLTPRKCSIAILRVTRALEAEELEE